MKQVTPTPNSSNPDVAIIIVTYNSEHQIATCLNSAINEASGFTQEIIVVDNGSCDATVSIIKEKFPTVRLYDTGKNLGFAKACNFAASQSEAAYYLLLNPDTVILDNAVGKVLDFATKYPNYGLYGGRTLKEDGKTLERSSCWGLPSLWSHFTFASGLSTLFKQNTILDPESLGSWKRDSVREVGVITGCFLLAGKVAWQTIGGFDEHFWLYGEDVDLSMKARNAGYRPVICPDAVVIHEVGQSSTSNQKMIWLFRGKVSLIDKHWSGLHSYFALTCIKFGVFIRHFAHANLGRKDNPWSYCWKNKREWQHGHPMKVSEKSN